MNILVILVLVVLLAISLLTRDEGDYIENNFYGSEEDNATIPSNTPAQIPTYIIILTDAGNQSEYIISITNISTESMGDSDLWSISIHVAPNNETDNASEVNDTVPIINDTEPQDRNSTYEVVGLGASNTDPPATFIILDDLNTTENDSIQFFCNETTYNSSELGDQVSQEKFDDIEHVHEEIIIDRIGAS